MRVSYLAACVAIGTAILTDCAGGNFGAPNTRPQSPGINRPVAVKANLPKKGVYVSEFYGGVFGYPASNKKNGPSQCTISETSTGAFYLNGIAVDGKGNFIEPDGAQQEVNIFSGPRMCGSPVGSISDPYGQPADASSNDAIDGPIAVANIYGTDGNSGSVSVCTLQGGCSINLTNANMTYVYAVAMAPNGDCWAASRTSTSNATLTYFAGCSGSGTAATGYENSTHGGLDIDSKGNLVAIDSSGATTGQIYVYKGCNPACKMIGGPYVLHGNALYGHLNRKSTEFYAADYANDQIDVYSYSATKGLKYLYEFNNGLGNGPIGVAVNPRSKE